jgi:hypothetical protein
MERLHYEFILEAATPIAHHSETFGNHAVLMRRKVRQPGGELVPVPYVTGDCIRHGIREASMIALLDAAGLLHGAELTEAALRLLFAGGQQMGAQTAIKLDEYRRLVDLLPPLGLLGGCAQNRIIPGRLEVGDALLVCAETWHLLPDWVRRHLAEVEGTDGKATVPGCREHVQEEQRVRMDPVLRPALRRLLSAGERDGAEQRLLAGEVAHEDGDAVAVERTKSTMLPRTYETIAAGSLMYWYVSAIVHDELERDTALVAILSWLAQPSAGGKRGTGHGRLRVFAGAQLHLPRPSAVIEPVDVQALGGRVGTVFATHVRERSEAIGKLLREVVA